MSSASRGEISKNKGSNLSGSGMKPPHGGSIFTAVEPGVEEVEEDQRSSGALPMRSLPSSRFRQYASRSGEPGKRPLIPTIAIGSDRQFSLSGKRLATSGPPAVSGWVSPG